MRSWQGLHRGGLTSACPGMTTGEMWVRDAVQFVASDSYIFHTDRFAVGQNVATTWTFKRMPPSRDAPEFKRHIMGWFDEVCVL